MLRKGRVIAPGLAMLATFAGAALALGTAGCASHDAAVASGRPVPGATETRSGTDPGGPVLLTGATLLTDGDSPRLLLSGAGPLSPTVYTREGGKRIVIDLPNVVAAPGLEPPRADGRLLAQVGMKSFAELGKPHLQFELVARTAIDPRLGTEPGTTAMAISLGRPVQEPAVASIGVAAPAATPVEPDVIRVESLPINPASEKVAAAPAVSPDPAVLRHVASGPAATRLGTVSTKRLRDGVAVSLGGDGEFSYQAFALADPPRYVVDLAGVKNASARKQQDVNVAAVSRVRVSQFKAAPEAVTRVVFDLSASAEPAIASTGKGLVLTFRDAGAPSKPAAASREPEPAPAVAASVAVGTASTTVAASEPVAQPASGSYEKHEIEESHESVVHEKAPSAVPEPVVVTAGVSPRTEVESEKSAVPAAAQAGATAEPAPEPAASGVPIVAAATAAPVAAPQIVAASPEIRIAPEVPSRPARRKKTATAEDRALMEAAEALLLQQEPAGRAKDLANPYDSKTIGAGEKVYNGEPITLNLKDADIKDTLQRFSELTGLNIVLDPDVKGVVTVSLTDIPWDQALELILKINGLGYVLEGNVMRIASNAKLAAEETNKLALNKAQEQNRPVKTVIQKLSYASATDTAGTAKKIMSTRGDIFVDERSNTLIIKELPDYLPTVLDLIKNLDAPTPQVMIEARIIEATRSFAKNLGVSWNFSGVADQSHGNTTGLVFPNHGTVGGAVSLPSGTQLLNFALGNVLDTFKLDFALSAAENHGLAKIISTPKVQAQTNQQASIQSGIQIPVQTVVNNTTTVLYIDATLRLDVTPQITSEGTVILDVKIQKREPAVALNVAGDQNIPLTTRDAKTRLMVRDGGTAVIGGIFKLSSNDAQSMIPGLWKIPLLGNLFRNKQNTEASDELMIFITPRIMKN